METPPARRREHQEGLESFVVIGKSDNSASLTPPLKKFRDYQLAVTPVDWKGGFTAVVSVDADVYQSANPGERIELLTYSFDRGRTRYLSLRDAAKFTAYSRDENVKDEGGEG